MAAMMFPSIWPMVGVYAILRGPAVRGMPAPRGRRGVRRRLPRGLDRGGLVPTGCSLRCWHSIDAFSWDRGGRFVAGGVILVAAVYQLTPLKSRAYAVSGPLVFLIGAGTTVVRGALRMGVAHGAWCLGCCWALMAALFALGVMSVGWMTWSRR